MRSSEVSNADTVMYPHATRVATNVGRYPAPDPTAVGRVSNPHPNAVPQRRAEEERKVASLGVARTTVIVSVSFPNSSCCRIVS